MADYPPPQRTPSPGSANFYDNYVPSLPAGSTYTIKASYTIFDTAPNPKTRSNPQESNDIQQEFTVTAPRWSLTLDEIYSCSPSPNSNSVFATHLPNIIIRNPQLPWERSITSNTSNFPIQPSPAVPWLALLVFSNGEINSPNSPLELQSLPQPQTYTQNPDFTYQVPVYSLYNGTNTTPVLQGVTLPNFSYDISQPPISSTEQTQNCQVICFSAALFNQFFRNTAAGGTASGTIQTTVPLPNGSGTGTTITTTATISPGLYAHVRQVNPEAQPDNGIDENGLYSVVFANRFPQTPTTTSSIPIINHIHLVSLEGWYSYITQGLSFNGNNASKPVCMVSLYSWSIGCLSAINDEDFSTIMQKVIGDPWGYNLPGNVGFLQPVNLPSYASNNYLTTRLSEGFYPIQYHLRTGEDTVAWYRSPLIPMQLQPSLNPPPSVSARGLPFPSSVSGTDLMIWDANYGMFDLTYATAWQLGRSLGIASQTFPISLMNFRRLINSSVSTTASNNQLIVTPPAEKNAFITNLSQMVTWITNSTVNNYINPQSGVGIHSLIAEMQSGVPGLQPDPRLDSSQLYNPLNEGYPNQTISNLITNTISNYVPSSLASSSTQLTSPDLDRVLAFLADLRLFNNMPFHYMVPDPNSLPNESIRYFYVDNYWVQALIDGALSLGVHVDQDLNFRSAIVAQLNTLQPTAQLPVYGFFLRSVAVTSWPGLNIYAGDIGNLPVFAPNSTTGPLLEVRRISPDILMVTFNTVAPVITISQPLEQLRFGLSGEGGLGTSDLVIRSLSGSVGQVIGPLIEYAFLTSPSTAKQPASLVKIPRPNDSKKLYRLKRDQIARVSAFLNQVNQSHLMKVINFQTQTVYSNAAACLDGTTRILNTNTLQQLLQTALELSSSTYLSPSQFAIQMTGAAEGFVLGLLLQPPSQLTYSAVQNSTNNVITVSWKAPTDSRVNGYNVYHQVPSIGVWSAAFPTSSLSYQFTLLLNTSYLFAVVSTSSSYPTARSNPVFYPPMISGIAMYPGSATITDPTGQVWVSDIDYSSGTNPNSTSTTIANTSTSALYQTERWGSSFNYTFPVINGNYVVTLQFAEIAFTTVGSRVFSVSINNTAVITNLDLVATVGAYKAYNVSFPIAVTTNQIVIQFTSSVNNAKISSLLIVPNLNNIARVHCGGGQVTDANNQLWLPDTGYYSSGTNPNSTSTTIANTSSPALYQTERWGSSFSYTFVVGNNNYGEYIVTLKFAEIAFTTVGSRVFSVSVNNTPIITNLDLVSQVGPYTAYDVSVPVVVTKNQIVIQFTASVNNAKISAIQISTKYP